MTRPLFIFDLDGTLAHNKQRAHLAPPKELMDIDSAWHTWGDACDTDTPYPDIVTTLNVLRAGGAEIWFWSARSARHKDKTARWLLHHVLEGPRPNLGLYGTEAQYLEERFGLKMRPEGENGKDHTLKLAWLEAMDPTDRRRLVGIFEDRNSVVKMWREAGVTCFHVAEAEW